MAPAACLTWHDFLNLAAALAQLATSRSRFISLGAARPSATNGAAPVSLDAVLPQRTIALARAGLYNFLAASFAEPPSAPFVESLCRSGALDQLAEKGLGGDGFRRWARASGSLDGAAELAAAYTQLLIRPGPHHAPPVASEYLCSQYEPAETLSWGPAADAAEKAYREAGLVVGGDGPSPPDHLAIELQFMQHCAAREAAAWGRGHAGEAALWRVRQRTFLTTHLLPWASAFTRRIQAAEAHPYYLALADLCAAFLAADAEGLAETVGALA